jgi:hypothetical protein
VLRWGILHCKQLPWLEGQALYSAGKIKIMVRRRKVRFGEKDNHVTSEVG